MTTPAIPEDLSLTAAEYVIGSLDAAERAAFELELGRNPDARRAVYEWQDRLLPMNSMSPPTDPSQALWARIESSLAARAAPARPAARIQDKPSAWGWLTLGRGLAFAALVLAVIVAVQLVPPDAPGSGRLIAELASTRNDGSKWQLQMLSARQLKLIPPAGMNVPADRALQFWTIPSGGKQPVSLGVIAATGPVLVDLKSLPPVVSAQHFAISLEPSGGSPTGQPTGPVLFAGDAIQLN
jgi:anti-sigma-K factor RskA